MFLWFWDLKHIGGHTHVILSVDAQNQSYPDHRHELYSRYPDGNSLVMSSGILPERAMDHSFRCTVHFHQCNLCDRTNHRRHLYELVHLWPAGHTDHDPDRRHRTYDHYFHDLYYDEEKIKYAGTHASNASGGKCRWAAWFVLSSESSPALPF